MIIHSQILLRSVDGRFLIFFYTLDIVKFMLLLTCYIYIITVIIIFIIINYNFKCRHVSHAEN